MEYTRQELEDTALDLLNKADEQLLPEAKAVLIQAAQVYATLATRQETETVAVDSWGYQC